MKARNEKTHAILSKTQAENADLKTEIEESKQRLKVQSKALQKVPSGAAHDSDYVTLKFEEWKNKMMCLTCHRNENDIILSCGHMSCNNCIQQSFNSRQRVCPVDRKKISQNDVIKIFWNNAE